MPGLFVTVFSMTHIDTFGLHETIMKMKPSLVENNSNMSSRCCWNVRGFRVRRLLWLLLQLSLGGRRGGRQRGELFHSQGSSCGSVDQIPSYKTSRSSVCGDRIIFPLERNVVTYLLSTNPFYASSALWLFSTCYYLSRYQIVIKYLGHFSPIERSTSFLMEYVKRRDLGHGKNSSLVCSPKVKLARVGA